MESVLERWDWVVLGIYFLVIIGIAAWVVLQKNKNTEDYFLAGRNVGWFVIGASIFASNIGSEHWFRTCCWLGRNWVCNRNADGAL